MQPEHVDVATSEGRRRFLMQARHRYVCAQISKTGLSSHFVVLVVCVLCWNRVPTSVIALYAGWNLLAFEKRRRDAAQVEQLDPVVALRQLAIGGMIRGIGYGMPGWLFFPWLDFPIRLFVLLVMAISASLAISTTGFSLTYYRCVALSILVPTGIAWLIAGLRSSLILDGAGNVLPELFFGIGMFPFIQLQDNAARLFEKSFVDSVMIRFEKDQLNYKLQQEQQALREARDQAEEANRAKSHFLAAASHDLRQPLHTLSLFSAALSLRPLDSRSHEIVDRMTEALYTLGAELDLMLDISKLDAGVVAISKCPADVGPMLARLVREFSHAAEAKGLRLELECQGELVIDTDIVQCERVFRNLIDNAIKYTDTGFVRVSGELKESSVLLAVSDSGCGIAEAEHERIFREFYQVGNPERDRTRGMGLGLAIVQRLVEKLDIELDLKSTLGSGSTFALTFARVNTRPVEEKSAEDPMARLSGCRVLVVDDEAGVREAMRTLLVEFGCSVEAAGTKEEALAACSVSRPDIVLADLRLRNRVTGIDVIESIRSAYGPIPAFLISGDSAPEEIEDAAARGLTLLHKPLTGSRLRAAISEHFTHNQWQ